MKTSLKKLPGSVVELSGEMDTADFEKLRPKAIAHLGEHLDIPGFRKGHISEDVIRSHAGEAAILEEMSELAIVASYPKMIEETKIDPIGHPKITVTKLAPGNPFEWKVEVAVFPEVTLPDYKKISEKKTREPLDASVTNDEVDKVVLNIRRQRAKASAKEDGNVEEIKDEDLPPMDEAFFASLGELKDLEGLKKLLRENMTHEKEHHAKDKRRMEIVKEVVDGSTTDIPRVLVESELARMLGQFKHDITNMGLKFDDYLKHLKKTEDDLRKEWEKDAETRAKTQLVLNKIAETEKISADDDAVEKEVKHVLEHYHDADASRARDYLEMVMTNEKVLEFLEKPSQ